MRLFERGDVVGAVSAHEAEIASFFACAEDVALLLGGHASEDGGVGREGGEEGGALGEEGAWGGRERERYR